MLIIRWSKYNSSPFFPLSLKRKRREMRQKHAKSFSKLLVCTQTLTNQQLRVAFFAGFRLILYLFLFRFKLRGKNEKTWKKLPFQKWWKIIFRPANEEHSTSLLLEIYNTNWWGIKSNKNQSTFRIGQSNNCVVRRQTENQKNIKEIYRKTEKTDGKTGIEKDTPKDNWQRKTERPDKY